MSKITIATYTPTKEEILAMVSAYITQKHASKTWTPGVDWVQYAGPFFDDKEIVAATNALLNEWLVLGEDAMKFESKFPPLLGKKYGVVTNSGSSANLLMLLTAKKFFSLPRGTQVMCPVAGFPTTVNPIIQAGFTPAFVDIEIETLNMNLQQIEMWACKGVKVLMFAHVLGNPVDIDRLMEIKQRHGLIILEDCCDALGTTFKGEPVGKYADMATCSFYPAHHMTMGEGGFVACSDPEQEKIARSLREWGRGCYCVGKKANLSTKGSCGCRFKPWLPAFPDVVFDHKYVYENIGYNLKPIELQCSMGLAQIEKLPEIHKRRRENHARLLKIFEPYEKYFHIHRATPNSDPSWFAFPITIKNTAPFKRSDFTMFLENNKIQTRNYFGGNLLLQPAYKNLEIANWPPSNNGDGYEMYSFPIATKVTTDTLFLGTSPVIASEQLDYVESKVKEFFTKYE